MLSSLRNPITLASFTVALALPAVAALRTNVVARSYDRFGRLVGLSVDGERRTEIAYDGATGRIASMRVAGVDEPFRWEYEPGSDMKKSLRYPNGAKVTWEYEPHRDLVTLVSNDVYSSFCYEYDAAGRRVSKNDERYEYNERGELTLATNVVTGAEFAYRYDDIGNRLWSRELGTNCAYAANELNQYTNIVRGGVSERTAFDLDGNQTNIVTTTGEWAVEYNGENRPVRWTRTSDAATVLMSYDRMGRRVRRNDETFVYDGYLNVSKTAWDPTESVATRPLVWRGEDGNAFYCHDGNKNVVDLVPASSSSVVRHFCYAPFGTVIADTPNDIVPWRFSSECNDDALGLVGYNYRHLDVSAGRWLGRERLEMDANLYSFVCNNAIGMIDRRGDAIVSASAIAGALAAYIAAISLNAMKACYDKTIDLGDGHGDAYHHCYTSCAYARCLAPLFGSRLSQYVTIFGGFLWEAAGSVKIGKYDGHFSIDDLRSDLIGVIGSRNVSSCEEACECEKGKNNP